MVGALLGVKEGGKWKGCRVRLGTTDSIAGFVGATQGITNCKGGVGTAVTSLGTTLAIKMVSERKIFDDERGVYSHVLPRYLMEGGGAVEPRCAGGAASLCLDRRRKHCKWELACPR